MFISLIVSLFFKDEKLGDEGGVLIEDEVAQQISEPPVDHEPETRESPPHNETESEKPTAIVETSEPPPKKHVPKNIVTSWSHLAPSKPSTTVKEAKENEHTSQSQVKR